MTRQSPHVIKLSTADRATLEQRSRSYTARHADVVRAKIVLLCADGHRNTAIAARLDVHVNSVCTWRKRFFEAGLDGLADRPRPGRPRSVPSGAAEARAATGAAAMRRGAPPAARAAARAATGGSAVMTGPGAAAPAGQLIPLRPHGHPATTLVALRHLASLIAGYLAEVDAGDARGRAGVAPTGR